MILKKQWLLVALDFEVWDLALYKQFIDVKEGLLLPNLPIKGSVRMEKDLASCVNWFWFPSRQFIYQNYIPHVWNFLKKKFRLKFIHMMLDKRSREILIGQVSRKKTTWLKFRLPKNNRAGVFRIPN